MTLSLTATETALNCSSVYVFLYFQGSHVSFLQLWLANTRLMAGRRIYIFVNLKHRFTIAKSFNIVRINKKSFWSFDVICATDEIFLEYLFCTWNCLLLLHSLVDCAVDPRFYQFCHLLFLWNWTFCVILSFIVFQSVFWKKMKYCSSCRVLSDRKWAVSLRKLRFIVRGFTLM